MFRRRGLLGRRVNGIEEWLVGEGWKAAKNG
jgi:hypothetical protein